MRLETAIDEHGLRRATVIDGPRILGWFLEQDVQNCFSTCDKLLAIIDDVRAGRTPPDAEPDGSWEGTGNAHTLTVRPTGAHISNEFAVPEERAEVSLDDLASAITAWRAFLESLGRESG
jgi:hypothetical protein